MSSIIEQNLTNQNIKLQETAHLFRLDADTMINRSGRSIKIQDPDGFVYSILFSLDGRQTIQEIYDRLPHRFRDAYSLDTVVDIIHQLDELKILENVSRIEAEKDILSEYEVSRWNRNFDFFNAYCSISSSKIHAQLKIKKSRVVLLGIGGVGTHALLDLISLGFVNIVAVDFDKIELSNLNRQILYGESDVGRKKTDTAKEAIYHYISPSQANIVFLDTFLDSSETVYQIVRDADVVLGCVDRPAHVVQWINEGCVRARVPFVTGGVDTTRTCTYTVLPGKTGCVECWRQSQALRDPNFDRILQLELERDVMALPPRPAAVHLVSVQVGFLMSEVLKIVTGLCPPSATNKLIEFDFQSMTISTPEVWDKISSCSVCSSMPEL